VAWNEYVIRLDDLGGAGRPASVGFPTVSARAGDSEGMTHISPGPEPERTTGLEPGDGFPRARPRPRRAACPGAGPRETHNPPKGWAKSPLTVIIVLAVLIAAFFLAYAIDLML